MRKGVLSGTVKSAVTTVVTIGVPFIVGEKTNKLLRSTFKELENDLKPKGFMKFFKR